MFIDENVHQIVVCKVPPLCQGYGYEFPVFTLYPDGSWSRVQDNKYWRSGPNVLPKPLADFTIADFFHLVKFNEVP